MEAGKELSGELSEQLSEQSLAYQFHPKPKYMFQGNTNHANLTVPNVVKQVEISDVLSSNEMQQHAKCLNDTRFKKEGYVLRANSSGIFIAAENSAGMQYAKEKAGQLRQFHNLSEHNEHNIQDVMDMPEILIIDYPEIEIRAVQEGFYGSQWSWKERRDVIQTCSEHGMNHFIFAPCDYYQKLFWREPLDVKYKENLEGLIRFAHERHTKFAYEFLPLGIDTNSARDYELLAQRCLDVVELGADAILLAWDDTNDYSGKGAKSRESALMHVRIVNKILDDVNHGKNSVKICFVPVEYYGVKDSPYLQVIRNNLDPDVLVGWTGRRIRNQSITADEADIYAELIGRKPFLSVNHPAGDETDKTRRIAVGPVMGLGKALEHSIAGFGINASDRPYSSLLPLLAGADYAWNPEAYQPEISMKRVCNLFGDGLIEFIMINPETPMNLGAAHPLSLLYQRTKEKDLVQGERKQLMELFKTMTSLDEIIRENIAVPQIADELKPWTSQANVIGTIGLGILTGDIYKLNWRTRAYAALKMNAGYRLSAGAFDNPIYRDLGFPASLFRYLPIKLLGDFMDRIMRKRHAEHKSKKEN